VGPAVEGVVTAIEAAAERPGRVAVYVDGALAAVLDARVAAQAALAVGQVVSAEQLDLLIAQDIAQRARTKAVRLLEVRDRSRWELQTRLRRAGFDANIIAATFDWLESLGYLDDARFALHYALEKYAKGWGPARIRSELGHRGVSRDLVDRALAQLGGEDDTSGGEKDQEQLQLLLQEVTRRFGRAFKEDRDKASKRIAGFLLRRGHDWDMVQKVIHVLEFEAQEHNN